MALLDEKKLLKLPVHTHSGTHLGKLVGFDFEPGQQMIMSYRVRPKGIAKSILKSPLRIGREQVLSITEEKMIVDDAVEKEMELEKARAIGLLSETQ